MREYTFNDCLHKIKLRFDFAILNDEGEVEFLIEYDGKQHYEPIPFFGGEKEFIKRRLRDKIKSSYCNEKNILLLRLPYFLTDEEIKQQILRILNDCGMPVAI